MHAHEDSHEFSKLRILGRLQAPNPLFNRKVGGNGKKEVEAGVISEKLSSIRYMQSVNVI